MVAGAALWMLFDVGVRETERGEWVSGFQCGGIRAALVLQLCLFDPYPQACLAAALTQASARES